MSELTDAREELELELLRMEIRKTRAEAAKLERERRLYPVVLASAGLVALGTVGGIMLRLLVQ